VLDRLTALGERVNRWRRAARGEREGGPTLPPLVEAAFAHLRETVTKRLQGDSEAEAALVEILARAASELQRRN
ncbi:MAG: PadR family transcriptional regulator, partial [Xanthobacteraceae bacterium]